MAGLLPEVETSIGDAYAEPGPMIGVKGFSTANGLDCVTSGMSSGDVVLDTAARTDNGKI